jgi:putative membrane protein
VTDGPAHPASAVATPAAEEPRRRLHPLSPLLRGGSWLVASIVALSWNTLAQVGVERFLLLVLALAAGAVVIAVVAWLNTGYHIVGRELRIQEGLLRRRNRAIPLERLQSVEVVRPLLAQLAGLAELRLEVVGGGKTEAPLAYLSVRDAAALRERLLSLAGHPTTTPGYAHPATAAPTLGAAPAAVPPERPLWAVLNSDLLISQLLTPQAFLLPFGVAFVIIQFATNGSWSFIGIASTVTAMAGVLLQPIRRVLQDWNFRLARDHEGRLAVRYGLLETRNQTVPLHRVQSLGATWPLLWRGKSWLHLRLDIAGTAEPQSGNKLPSNRLLPVGDFETARALIWEVLPGVDMATLAVSPPPERARWLHPIALRSIGAGLTDRVFVSRWGLLTRELTIVPYARIQSVRVVQGPWQRRLRLATVYADTAGGPSGAARDRDLHEAWAFAAELTARARLARGPLPAPNHPAPGYPQPAATYPAPDQPVADHVAAGPAGPDPVTASTAPPVEPPAPGPAPVLPHPGGSTGTDDAPQDGAERSPWARPIDGDPDGTTR